MASEFKVHISYNNLTGECKFMSNSEQSDFKGWDKSITELWEEKNEIHSKASEKDLFIEEVDMWACESVDNNNRSTTYKKYDPKFASLLEKVYRAENELIEYCQARLETNTGKR